MNLAASLALLVAPIAIYWFIIRPRLHARVLELYADVDGLLPRLWARIVAFKTWLIGAVGIYASELPAVLAELQFVDVSFLPEGWQTAVRVATLIGVMLSRAYSTKPGEAK